MLEYAFFWCIYHKMFQNLKFTSEDDGKKLERKWKKESLRVEAS